MNPKLPESLPVWHPAFLLATWFGVGLLPKIPGTWGSAAALPFALFIVWLGGHWALLAASIAAFVASIWAAEVFSRYSGVKDAGPIVIDKVAGQWLTLWIMPTNPVAYLMGFFYFRVFDILKPWPARWAVREVKGGLGVVLGGMIAGVYAMMATILTYFALSWLLLHQMVI